MRISDWSSDVCSSDLVLAARAIETRIKQFAGFSFAGRGAAMLQNDVETVVGADAADGNLRGNGADESLDPLGGGAGSARRAIQARPEPTQDPERRVVDQERDPVKQKVDRESVVKG